MSNISDKIGELQDAGYIVFDPATDEGLETMIEYLRDMGYAIVSPEKERTIVSVDADCYITYSDGKTEPCIYQPSYTFAECGPGYGPNRGCAKYNYHHNGEIE